MLVFSGIALGQLPHTLEDIAKECGVHENVSSYLERTALYQALLFFFDDVADGFDSHQNECNMEDNNQQTCCQKKMKFPDFVDSLLDSAMSDLEIAELEDSPLEDEQEGYKDYFCPVEPPLIALSMQYCRCILANVFLGNIFKDPVKERKRYTMGGLSLFTSMMGRCNDIGMNKTKCIIQYFFTSDEERKHSDRKIVFQKVTMTNQEFESVLHSSLKVDLNQSSSENRSLSKTVPIRIHDELMEDPSDDAFVNFANANYGYGKFISSCTQEEILQMCCPEFNIGMLMYNKMDDNTVILVHNCRRYSSYLGYLWTFKFEGPTLEGFKDQSIVALDAVFSGHYTNGNNFRDTKKVYLVWKGIRDWFNSNDQKNKKHCDQTEDNKNVGTIRISTGRWGCGAFGGQVLHKYFQQLIALQLANETNGGRPLSLSFSSFGDPQTFNALERVRSTITQNIIRTTNSRGIPPVKVYFSRKFYLVVTEKSGYLKMFQQ